ncbi:MAG: flavin prenyltransferase UbiX [Bacillota bacterium]|nr:flavin prenyltransferase UbiX [Bacillota bacterium]
MQRYIVAITGASGVLYGVRLVQILAQKGYEVHLIVSEAAYIVLQQEIGWELSFPQQDLKNYFPNKNIFLYMNSDIAAPVASGSFLTAGMVIIPCSMSTLSSVAVGLSNNLIERVADVMIKEKRPLTLVPRETPLSSIHLQNMLRLSEMGVSIVPAMPAFYQQPKSVDEMISFVIGKVLDIMKVPNDSFPRYNGDV